jgi:hypothetical protein
MRLASACFALFAVATTAAAQTTTYDLLYQDHLAGKDVVKLAQTKQGFKLTSRFSYRGSGAGSDGDYLNEFRLTPSYMLEDATLTNEADTSVTSYILTKKRDELTMALNLSQEHQTAVVAVQSNFVVLPPFDAGAAQAVLLNLAQPGATATLNLIAPPDPHAPATLRAEQHNVAGQWAQGPDLDGTLDGKPISVHTFLLTIPRGQWVMLGDANNNLMQCMIPAIRLTYTRQSFHLTGALPAATAFHTH